MRILLTSNASHLPPRGGSTRSNLVWLEYLASRGHACRVVCGALPTDTPDRRERVRRELEDQGIECTESTAPVSVAHRSGVEIDSIPDASRRSAELKRHIQEFQPDWVLVSSEDIGQALLRSAHQQAPGHIVYLAHTPQFYPFGPASWNPDPEAAHLIRRSAAVVAIGHHTAEYIERHLGRQAVVIHPPIYGAGPFERSQNFQHGLITIINPCAVKGISIFLALAEKFPDLKFGALPGWGTTSPDRSELERHSNITLLRSCKNIEQILKETRILMAPSLWVEGFGLVVVEAMLRGIPVVASDAGGLVEAKLGTHFVIPVRLIQNYEHAFDDQGLPKPQLPQQDIEPWARAIHSLVSDRALFETEAQASQRAALDFVARLHPADFEEFLASLTPLGSSDTPSRLDQLSAQKRELLLRRLRAGHKASPEG